MVEGLISLTLLTSTGVTTKPLLGLVVTNGLALVGGTALGGLVTYPLTKRRERQEKERLSQALAQAEAKVEEADALRQELAVAQAEIGHLLSNAAEVAQVVSTALASEVEASEVEAPEVSVEVSEASEAPEASGAPEAPEVPEVPEVPEAPEASGAPEVPEMPEMPEVSGAPEVPEVSGAPEVPEVSGAPEASEVLETPEAVPASVPDDLKKIKGVGKVFETRLNEAGIWTFADLIETEPEKLREIVSSGRVQNIIQLEEWIEQAREWVE